MKYTIADDYPYITTAFTLFGPSGEIRNDSTNILIKKEDIEIYEMEKGIPVRREVMTDPECPPAAQGTFSAILTVDISTSMSNPSADGTELIDIVKDALKNFIGKIDKKRSEVAITAFCGDAIPSPSDPYKPIHTFTTDKDSLLQAVDNMPPLCGGTNYNAAFLYRRDMENIKNLSALWYCKPDVARYKPIIIFVTDGNHLPKWGGTKNGGAFQISDVVTLTNQRNAAIYVIVVGQEVITQDNIDNLNILATIGKPSDDKTPNIWMNIKDGNRLKAIYDSILVEAGTIGYHAPCYATWKTGCEGGSATFTFVKNWNVSSVTNYSVSSVIKPELEMTPNFITFNSTYQSTNSTKTIKLKALKNFIDITGYEFITDTLGSDRISITNWGKYGVPPFTIPKDSSVEISLQYSPHDTSSTSAVIKFTGFVCSGGEIAISAKPLVSSERLELLYTIADDYPYMTTCFKLYDAFGKEIRNDGTNIKIKKEDIQIYEMENGQRVMREVLSNPDCPKQTQTAFSAIFSIDFSTSMGEQLGNGTSKINVVKDIFKNFIKDFDPKRTEVAITGFCCDALESPFNPKKPISEFTTDKDSLLMVVDNFPPLCIGTNYNAAFLHQRNDTAIKNLSALYYTRPDVARFKPVIIFITDGNHETDCGDTAKIFELSELAIQRNATIYVISIGNGQMTSENIEFLNQITAIGKPTSDKTPNIWMNINEADELKGIYDDILAEAGTIGDPAPCCVSWKAGCEGGSATFSLPNHGSESGITNYTVNPDKIPELEITPSKISFDFTALGSSSSKKVTIKALNNFVEISGLEFLTDTLGIDRIRISDWGKLGAPPFILPKDSSIEITFEYSPADSQRTSAVVQFTGFVCKGGKLEIIAEQKSGTGVNDNSLFDYAHISVYPNPVEDKIQLNISGLPLNKNDFLNGKLKISIYDCMGNKICESGEFDIGEKIEISTANLSSGTYFVSISGWNFNKICPFVVLK